MSRTKLFSIVAALAVAGALFYFYTGHEAPPGQTALVDLKPENADTFRSAFNASKGEIRLLLLLSPT